MGKLETYSVKTLHQLLITQAVVCVKPRIKVLSRNIQRCINTEKIPTPIKWELLY